MGVAAAWGINIARILDCLARTPRTTLDLSRCDTYLCSLSNTKMSIRNFCELDSYGGSQAA